MRILGFIVFIPASMLLTASFFVLFAIEKVKENGLKAFGKVVAAILIIVSVLIFAKGIYTIATGKCPMMQEMQARSREHLPIRRKDSMSLPYG